MRDFDEGPWSVFSPPSARIGVISSDFRHDVVLYVTGDFADRGEKLLYAQDLAEALNDARVARQQDH